MSNDYEQMKMDLTLQRDRDLKENVQLMVRFALQQILNEDCPDPVKNRHEGYGIAADKYSALGGSMKSIQDDMKTYLKLLADEGNSTLNTVGSLYNSAVEAAVKSIRLAAETQRILNDLYYGEKKTPLEEYIEEQDVDNNEDGFSETGELEAESMDEDQEDGEDE
jgi:hypothetical protein